jgi:hypothetical protein
MERPERAAGIERPERPPQYSASPLPRPQKPSASAMDESYEIPRYAPKRDADE